MAEHARKYPLLKKRSVLGFSHTQILTALGKNFFLWKYPDFGTLFEKFRAKRKMYRKIMLVRSNRKIVSLIVECSAGYR